jgi:hypothetical protein
MKIVTYSARKRAERLKAGLCAQCGASEHEPGRTRCKPCLRHCRRLSAKRRRYANRHGLCQACLRRKQWPGRGRRCRKCADFYSIAQRVRDRARREHEQRA